MYQLKSYFSISVGKYVPAISYKIHKMNKNPGNVRIPLKGLAIGDGLCDPIHQMDYGDFMFQTGLVDENDRNQLNNMSQLTKKYINFQAWEQASDVRYSFRLYAINPG